ncbi:MAG: hypothetical protein ABIX01_23355 [Chitinophagaceae bacterium]
MKFIVTVLLTGLLAFALGGYLDWWSIAIAAFVVAALIPQRPLLAWLSGFLGLFLLWGGLSFLINEKNGGVFAAKVATVLQVGGHAMLLMFITAFVAALVAGFAALSGSYLRKVKPRVANL